MQAVHSRHTTHIKDTKDDNIVFVILSAGVGNRMRSYGPKCLFKTSEETILDKQISTIKSNFPRNEIILVVGFESNKIIKKITKRRKNYKDFYTTQKQKDGIRQYYQEDIDEFKFTFEK